MSRRQAVALGAFVEQCPVKTWTRIPAEVSMESLWQLVGPQVEKHIQQLPLWKVFCVVYYEGLAHGVGGLVTLQESKNV